MSRRFFPMLLGALAPFFPTDATGQGCQGLAGFDRLDFWLGEWDVMVGGGVAGENRIEKILGGCAVMEFWRGAGGGEGRSLFYHDHVSGAWKQVWITDNATAPGGLKEKTLIDGAPAGAVRFQGTVALADGRTFLDRTTLTPMEGGRVRQVIEISLDGGETWQTRFDGMYVRKTGGGADGARAVLERALGAIGGEGAIGRAGGLVLGGEGHWDLGERLQGMRPFESERHALVERLALDPERGRTVYETRSLINPDAEEWLRYDYRTDGAYIVDMLSRRAFRGGDSGRARIERAVPHLLLEEALAADSALRDLGESRRPEGARRVIGWSLPQGPELMLYFDTREHLLREVGYVTDMAVRGETEILWRYMEYEAVEGLGRVPRGYSVEVDGSVIRDVTYTSLTTGTASDLYDVPADIRYPEPAPATSPVATPTTAAEDAEAETFDIRELDPGVYLLPNVRGGFHVLFIEFDDFVLAVDAPAGWLELQELPAVMGARAGGSTGVGERYLRAIRSRIPDKAVRYVALTHHHDDHAGGVRPFLEAGATVLGSAITERVVREAMQRSGPVRFETVQVERVIADDSMEVRLIDVGPNPHVEGMLAVYLPRQRLLYVADLFEPTSEAFFPSPARLPVMRWFVDWLDASGLDPERIYAIHGRGLVSPEQLEIIREFDRS